MFRTSQQTPSQPVAAAVVSTLRPAVVCIALISGVVNVLALTSPLFMLQVYDRVLSSRSVSTLVGLAVLTGGLGDDTFVFGSNWGSDIITDFGDAAGNNDIIDLTAIASITDINDLLFNHTNFADGTGVLTIFDGANTIQVNGYVGSDIFTLASNGSILV